MGRTKVKKISLGLLLVATMMVSVFAYSRMARARSAPETSAVCNDGRVSSSNGGFNIVAQCGTGTSATGGGYEILSGSSSLDVTQSFPYFHTPSGWEVVGTAT